MASKFMCDCGNLIYTNLFEGHGIYSLVSDIDFDKLEGDPISRKAVSEMWFWSKRAIECKNCGRLYVAKQAGPPAEYEVYEKVSD
jgi:hypothetical protein